MFGALFHTNEITKLKIVLQCTFVLEFIQYVGTHNVNVYNNNAPSIICNKEFPFSNNGYQLMFVGIAFKVQTKEIGKTETTN